MNSYSAQFNTLNGLESNNKEMNSYSAQFNTLNGLESNNKEMNSYSAQFNTLKGLENNHIRLNRYFYVIPKKIKAPHNNRSISLNRNNSKSINKIEDNDLSIAYIHRKNFIKNDVAKNSNPNFY
jgi:hypothetical protein